MQAGQQIIKVELLSAQPLVSAIGLIRDVSIVYTTHGRPHCCHTCGRALDARAILHRPAGQRRAQAERGLLACKERCHPASSVATRSGADVQITGTLALDRRLGQFWMRSDRPYQGSSR